MSFEFRDRVNRGKPRLSDRLRGKSGEEIVEELRKDFAKRKQMFFDTAPRTSEFMKPGFPFDDSSSRWRNRGDSDLRHRLDEIAQRYPEFATQLRDWTTDEEAPSGMGWGSKQAQAQPAAPQQATSHTEAATTTQQPQPQPPPTQTGPEGDVRTQRAMSAPPDNRTKDQPQRFVSRLEINPNNASGETAQQQPPQQPPQAASQPPQPTQPQQPQAEPKKKASNVRHIPIFVEDRNETVMPRADVDTTTTDFGTAFGSPPRERDSRDREDGFHGPAYAKYAPPTFGFMNKPKWRPSPFMSRDPMHGSPPQQHHFPHQQAHHSQQQHHPQSHPQPQQHHQPQQHQQPHQQPQQTPHPQPPQPEPPKQQTPPRQPPPPKDPLQEVAAVQKDVDELMKQVEAFTGTRKDKQYIYLDEMLTRNLLKLDLVETEGKENVRAARKETIKCIQKSISILESKTMTPEELAARDRAMEVEPESTEEVQSMEVSSGDVGDKKEAPTPGPADSSASSTSVPSANPQVPSEPSSTSTADAPAEAPAPMDTTSAPADQPSSTEVKAESDPSSTATPETPAQPPAPETTVTCPPENNPPADAAAPAAAS